MALFLKKMVLKTVLNFPPNLREDILFDKLPCLTHSKNTTLNNIIKNGMVDNLELQNIFWQLV